MEHSESHQAFAVTLYLASLGPEAADEHVSSAHPPQPPPHRQEHQLEQGDLSFSLTPKRQLAAGPALLVCEII